MAECLGDDLRVDAAVKPGLGGPMAEGMEIVATGDVGLDGQPVHQLPDTIRGKRTTLDVEPEGITTVGGTLRQIGQDRLRAGFAQENLAPAAFAVHPGNALAQVQLAQIHAD